MASKIDDSIFIVWDECEKNTKQMIVESISEYMQDGFFKVIYESDEDISEAVDNLNANLKEHNIYEQGAENIYSGAYQNLWKREKVILKNLLEYL